MPTSSRFKKPGLRMLAIVLVALSPAARPHLIAATSALVGWSDMGIRETDGSDVSVYTLMPPYNTIHAQLMLNGRLVTNAAGITVTYEAVADSTGSINTTSQGKGNFHQYSEALFGVALPADGGLAGFGMPGPANQPQAMVYEPVHKWFTATGIPITPYDDQGRKNYYPLMRLVARNSSGAALASTDIVLPVSDEMDCRSCHASGSQPIARPVEGWAWDCDPDRDAKLNILRNHDDHFVGSTAYTRALSEVGYNSRGLVATVVQDGKPILCVKCHASNALPGTGASNMRPLTQLMHMKHAYVKDPDSGVPLNNANVSASCLRCHAGPDDRRVRGVHHRAINLDGSRTLQCQNCHGPMTELGRSGRKGWLEEPSCQSCHTGTASRNNGQIRYTSAFEAAGQVRQAMDQTFATQTNTPAAGLSLYRFSKGHGGLSCEACHGSTHAELPSLQSNDTLQSRKLQGSPGSLVSCRSCHTNTPAAMTGGPHGMHPVDEDWAEDHEFGNRNQCQTCHGTPDPRGTELSQSLADRTFNTMGTKRFWTGFQIGCYNCHAGPNSENSNGNSAATVVNLSTNTSAGTPVAIALRATDPNGNPVVLRIVAQPAHGTVSLNGTIATYHPSEGFVGTDSFTYAAWDGSTDSNLGTVSITSSPGNCALSATALVPTAALPGATVPFGGHATLSGCAGPITYHWDFGDNTPPVGTNITCHQYAVSGDYSWKLTVTANDTTQIAGGVITISPTLGAPLSLSITPLDFTMLLTWPADRIPTALETSANPGVPSGWLPVTDEPVSDSTNIAVETFVLPGPQYFRVRRVP